jgi:AcrR family transcriptional regulator
MATVSKTRRGSKRASIVSAARYLFNRFGFRRVTVKEICRRAGTSKMTFYKHFANKLDIFKFVWNTLIDEAYNKVDEIDAMPIPFPEKLKLILEYKMSLMAQMSPELLEELLGGDPEILSFVDEIRRRSLRLFLEFAERAQERGDMRKMRPELFLAVMQKVTEIANDAELRSAYPSPMDFVRELNDFIFYGLLPGEPGGG